MVKKLKNLKLKFNDNIIFLLEVFRIGSIAIVCFYMQVYKPVIIASFLFLNQELENF